MKLFEEFTAALQNTPDINYGGHITAGDHKVVLGGQVNAGTAGIKKKILNKLDQTNFFILSMDAVFPKFVSEVYQHATAPNDADHYESLHKMDGPIDLDVAPPFKTCWFQFPEPGNGYFNGIYDRQKGHNIYALWLHEVAPHEYVFCFIMNDKNMKDSGLRFSFGEATQVKNHDIWHSIALWLQPFSKGYTGASKKIPDRVKYRHPVTGQKVIYKLRRVVMVYPKKLKREDRLNAENDGVEFSHRWEVRSHWRRLFYLDERVDDQGNKVIDFSRIGKNREGDYVVAGHTYVEEGVKGPEHLPIVKKMRVVHGDRDDDNPD